MNSKRAYRPELDRRLFTADGMLVACGSCGKRFRSSAWAGLTVVYFCSRECYRRDKKEDDARLDARKG